MLMPRAPMPSPPPRCAQRSSKLRMSYARLVVRTKLFFSYLRLTT